MVMKFVVPVMLCCLIGTCLAMQPIFNTTVVRFTGSIWYAALCSLDPEILYPCGDLRRTHPGLHRVLHHEDRTGDDRLDHCFGADDRSDAGSALRVARPGA